MQHLCAWISKYIAAIQMAINAVILSNIKCKWCGWVYCMYKLTACQWEKNKYRAANRNISSSHDTGQLMIREVERQTPATINCQSPTTKQKKKKKIQTAQTSYVMFYYYYYHYIHYYYCWYNNHQSTATVNVIYGINCQLTFDIPQTTWTYSKSWIYYHLIVGYWSTRLDVINLEIYWHYTCTVAHTNNLTLRPILNRNTLQKNSPHAVLLMTVSCRFWKLSCLIHSPKHEHRSYSAHYWFDCIRILTYLIFRNYTISKFIA